MTKTRKQFAAFLSYAEPDGDLVQAIHNLFAELDLPTHFAPVDLPARGTPDWRRAIVSGIAASAAFLPVVTRHSLTRPWVMFESGAAEAHGLNRFPARVAGVRPEHMANVPRTVDAWMFDLWRPQSLKALVSAIYREFRGDSALQQNQRTLDAAVQASRHTNHICFLASRRSVFIAGSVPRDQASLARNSVRNEPALQGEMVLEYIAADIARALLDHGFDIGSCSEVPRVGESVSVAANRWLAENNEPEDSERYSIGGLYPIDRDRRSAMMAPREKAQWQRLFMAYRASYLHKYEWLLAVGGKEGTLEEIEAARRLPSVRVCLMPQFGGTVMEVWSTYKFEARGPFTPDDRAWDDSLRERLVKFLASK